MEIAALVWRVETRVTPSVSFSLPPRRRAFWLDGDLGSSNRPFPRRCPRSNGSARESSGSNVAGSREAALEPPRLHPSEWSSGGLERGWMAQSAVVRDYSSFEVGRRRANRLA